MKNFIFISPNFPETYWRFCIALRDCGLNVPIRVDHVPTLVGETMSNPGYGAYGRLFALGYLKGILEALDAGE